MRFMKPVNRLLMRHGDSDWGWKGWVMNEGPYRHGTEHRVKAGNRARFQPPVHRRVGDVWWRA